MWEGTHKAKASGVGFHRREASAFEDPMIKWLSSRFSKGCYPKTLGAIFSHPTYGMEAAK